MMLHKFIDQLGDWNPQLFRELKGRLTVKSLGIIGSVSLLSQGLLYFSFFSSLPTKNDATNTYCIGTAPAGFDSSSYHYSGANFCVTDALGHFTINWSLWWMNIFFALSLIGFFVVLIAGTYLLIQDLGKEEKVGTLNFVRLSPQPATAIALGKILGVPCLVYSFIAFGLPLHFWAGLRGGIPLHLLGMFYIVIAACCLFFYSGAMLYALISQGGAGVKSWSVAGALFYTMSTSTMFVTQEHSHLGNLLDGVMLLNPLHILIYLSQASPAANDLFWFRYDSLSDVTFFRLPLWNWAAIATLCHLVIYGVGIYWFAQAFKRKFHNPQATFLSKKQSYLLTSLLTIFALGFTVQAPISSVDTDIWLANFASISICAVFYLFTLIAILSPAYQSLQDWSRYQNHGVKEWLLGERSPVFWAIMVNACLAFVPMAIAAFWFMGAEYKLPFVLGMAMQLLLVALLTIVAQFLLLSKHKKRSVAATAFVLSSIFFPLIFLAINTVNPEMTAAPWLWTIVPMAATKGAALTTIIATVLGQTAAIAVLHQLVQGRLKRIGSSELNQLLTSDKQPTA